MPELKPVVKKNTLSPNVKISAFQLTPEEHADGRWHGAGIDKRDESTLEPIKNLQPERVAEPKSEKEMI